MKKIRKTIYRINRAWMDVEENCIMCDRTWSSDLDDTYSLDFEDRKEKIIRMARREIGRLYEKDDKKFFTLYTIEKGESVFVFDDDYEITDDFLDERLWWQEIEGQWEAVFKLASCTDAYRKSFACLKDYVSLLRD